MNSDNLDRANWLNEQITDLEKTLVDINWALTSDVTARESYIETSVNRNGLSEGVIRIVLEPSEYKDHFERLKTIITERLKIFKDEFESI